jgi:hypothetical protein
MFKHTKTPVQRIVDRLKDQVDQDTRAFLLLMEKEEEEFICDLISEIDQTNVNTANSWLRKMSARNVSTKDFVDPVFDHEPNFGKNYYTNTFSRNVQEEDKEVESGKSLFDQSTGNGN